MKTSRAGRNSDATPEHAHHASARPATLYEVMMMDYDEQMDAYLREHAPSIAAALIRARPDLAAEHYEHRVAERAVKIAREIHFAVSDYRRSVNKHAKTLAENGIPA